MAAKPGAPCPVGCLRMRGPPRATRRFTAAVADVAPGARAGRAGGGRGGPKREARRSATLTHAPPLSTPGCREPSLRTATRARGARGGPRGDPRGGFECYAAVGRSLEDRGCGSGRTRATVRPCPPSRGDGGWLRDGVVRSTRRAAPLQQKGAVLCPPGWVPPLGGFLSEGGASEGGFRRGEPRRGKQDVPDRPSRSAFLPPEAFRSRAYSRGRTCARVGPRRPTIARQRRPSRACALAGGPSEGRRASRTAAAAAGARLRARAQGPTRPARRARGTTRRRALARRARGSRRGRRPRSGYARSAHVRGRRPRLFVLL